MAEPIPEEIRVPERPRLQAESRTVRGRAVKRLRQSGVIPANLVTPNQPSTAVQVDERALATLVRHGADGRLLDLECDGTTEAVLFDEYELDTITDRLLHATFRRVDLTKPVTVEVGIELEGTAPAAAVMGVTVIQSLTTLEVTALPSEIPSALVASVAGLEGPGDEVVVADLRAVDGTYTPVGDPAESVVGVHVLRAQADDIEEEELDLDEVEIEPGEEGEAAEAPPEEAPPA